jgi:hypothetical protein
MKKLKLPTFRRKRKPINGYLRQPTGFVWSCRYSSTDEPDKQGRWARMCHYRGLMIAWVYMIVHDDKINYTVKDYFPSDGYSLPFKGDITKSYEAAKAGVERRFLEFLETCR